MKIFFSMRGKRSTNLQVNWWVSFALHFPWISVTESVCWSIHRKRIARQKETKKRLRWRGQEGESEWSATMNSYNRLGLDCHSMLRHIPLRRRWWRGVDGLSQMKNNALPYLFRFLPFSPSLPFLSSITCIFFVPIVPTLKRAMVTYYWCVVAIAPETAFSVLLLSTLLFALWYPRSSR